MKEVIWVGRCPICRKDIFAEGDEYDKEIYISKIQGYTYCGSKKKIYFCPDCWEELVKGVTKNYEEKIKR